MIASLTSAMIKALEAMGNHPVTKDEIRATSPTMQHLERRRLVEADRDGYYPILYTITPLGRELVALLQAEFRYIEHEQPVARIQRLTAATFRIPVAEMTSQRRGRAVSRPRQIAMYLARETTPLSLPNIGRLFGGRDHTTVIHAINQVERLISVDEEIRSSVAKLRSSLSVPPQSIHRDEPISARSSELIAA